MQSSNAAFLVCALTVWAVGLVSSVEEFELKPAKKPSKFFKDQFQHKPLYSFAEPGDDGLKNPLIPPPVPRNGDDAPQWSLFLNPSSHGMTAPGEQPTPGPDDKKESRTETEAEGARAQRFIGGTGIDPFFYSNPLTPPSLPALPSHPKMHTPGYGYNYNYYPNELFMVVQPKLCSNATEKNSTDVAIKFLSGSSSPEPSRCTFGIASCCAPFNYHIRYQCFEMMGCYNAFWDINPCTEDVVKTAVDELSNFYRSDPKNSTTPAAPNGTEERTNATAPAAES